MFDHAAIIFSVNKKSSNLDLTLTDFLLNMFGDKKYLDVGVEEGFIKNFINRLNELNIDYVITVEGEIRRRTDIDKEESLAKANDIEYLKSTFANMNKTRLALGFGGIIFEHIVIEEMKKMFIKDAHSDYMICDVTCRCYFANDSDAVQMKFEFPDMIFQIIPTDF